MFWSLPTPFPPIPPLKSGRERYLPVLKSTLLSRSASEKTYASPRCDMAWRLDRGRWLADTAAVKTMVLHFTITCILFTSCSGTRLSYLPNLPNQWLAGMVGARYTSEAYSYSVRSTSLTWGFRYWIKCSTQLSHYDSYHGQTTIQCNKPCSHTGNCSLCYLCTMLETVRWPCDAIQIKTKLSCSTESLGECV